MANESDDKVLEIIEVAKATGKLRKGTNETTKAVEKGQAKFVVIAKDVSPPEITMHIPVLCKEKGVPCHEVASREELGAAAGLTLAAACITVADEGEAKKLLAELTKE